VPTDARARKSEPHRCPDCGAAFDVTYFDDRTGVRSQLPMTTTEAACPVCGRTRSVALPAGAASTRDDTDTLVRQRSRDGEANALAGTRHYSDFAPQLDIHESPMIVAA